MYQNFERIKSSAFTLIELMVATAIMSLIALAAISLNNTEREAKITNERINSATLMIREFFDQRGLVFQTAVDGGTDNRLLDIFDFTDTPTSSDYPTTDLVTDGVYSIDQIQPPTPPQSIPGYDGTTATAIKTYRAIRIPTQRCFGKFYETLTTECVAPPRSLASVDWSALANSDLLDLRACAPQPDPNGPQKNMVCPSGMIPRIKIVRSGTLSDGTSPSTFLTTFRFPSGDMSGADGNPVGAVLCISINGERRKSTNSQYRDINLKVLTLIRTGANKIKLLRQEANYPRPKKLQTNSVPPSPSGCDRCASGRAKCS